MHLERVNRIRFGNIALARWPKAPSIVRMQSPQATWLAVAHKALWLSR